MDPSKGKINNVFFTCPREAHISPSWPTDSDGSWCGMPSGIDDHQGVGFPLQKCDSFASPLRADVHFPSCYNPAVNLTSFKDNMEFPTTTSNGRLNCPKGYLHIPRLLFEVYWDTNQFEWTPDGRTQPFVLSNGDVTGYSLHADFLASWDEGILQDIIDNCDVQHNTMDTCPGMEGESNTDECLGEGAVDTFRTPVSSRPSKRLPGNNPLSGFRYGNIGESTPDAGIGRREEYVSPKLGEVYKAKERIVEHAPPDSQFFAGYYDFLYGV